MLLRSPTLVLVTGAYSVLLWLLTTNADHTLQQRTPPLLHPFLPELHCARLLIVVVRLPMHCLAERFLPIFRSRYCSYLNRIRQVPATKTQTENKQDACIARTAAGGAAPRRPPPQPKMSQVKAAPLQSSRSTRLTPTVLTYTESETQIDAG